MYCPKCQSSQRVKAGFTRQVQRYQCKHCGCHYTRSAAKGLALTEKRKAVHLYIEGVGYRAIGRLLNVSHVTIKKWIAEASTCLAAIQPKHPARAEPVELQKMWQLPEIISSHADTGWLITPSDECCWILLREPDNTPLRKRFETGD